jgi:hypothetical protein
MNYRIPWIAFAMALSTSTGLSSSDVRVFGQMRRMFMAHEIGPNVDLRKITREPPE